MYSITKFYLSEYVSNDADSGSPAPIIADFTFERSPSVHDSGTWIVISSGTPANAFALKFCVLSTHSDVSHKLLSAVHPSNAFDPISRHLPTYISVTVVFPAKQLSLI